MSLLLIVVFVAAVAVVEVVAGCVIGRCLRRLERRESGKALADWLIADKDRIDFNFQTKRVRTDEPGPDATTNTP